MNKQWDNSHVIKLRNEMAYLDEASVAHGQRKETSLKFGGQVTHILVHEPP